jgi:hypothetical protein
MKYVTLVLAATSAAALAGPTTNLGSSLLEYSGASGGQGVNGWQYGYYNRSGDAGGVYSGAEFQPLPHNGGSGWALGGNPPWTSIGGNQDGHPNSVGNGGEHWVVRRYTVQPGEGGGLAEINWLLRKSNPNCGDGVAGFIYHNGTLLDSVNVGFNDTAGALRKTVTPTFISPGDTIDIMLSPLDPNNDGCDGSLFYMEMNRQNVFSGIATTAFADSLADFGQNTNGWTYGYYNTTANGSPGPGEFIPFDGSAWNGASWDLNPAASGPWSEITADGGHPNGTNSAPGEEHWVTRRYTIQPGEEGTIIAEWNLAKSNTGGGAGTSVHILWNGVEVASTGVQGTDGLGFTGRIDLPGTQVGDTIDIALAPQGLDAELFGSGDNADGADGSRFGLRLYAVPEPAVHIGILLALSVFALRRGRK